jgi:hypothetical protein
MSLDVYLTGKAVVRPVGTGICVREDGGTRELTRDEASARYPDIVLPEDECETDDLFSANITHNLNWMADSAGIYQCLWRPDEIGITQASQLIAPLAVGLALLVSCPDRFKAFNPENGWGNYDNLVRFVRNYLDACKAYPDATVRVSR